MQMNDYDWFDHYDAEKNGVPEITSEEIAADAVAKRVQEQLGITIKPIHSQRRRTWTRWAAGAAAAAVLVTGGTMLSAAAGIGGTEAFFHSLFSKEVPEHPEKMESLVTVPHAVIDSTNAQVQFALLGMYGDDSQAMLSFSVTAVSGVSLADGLKIPYQLSVLDTDGTVLLEEANDGGTVAELREKNGAYYLNLSIRKSGLQGKKLELTFQNFYTEQQIQAIDAQVNQYEDSFLSDYVREMYGAAALDGLAAGELPAEFDVAAWKAYRNQQHLEQKRMEKRAECYASSDTVTDGTWHTAIDLNFAVNAPITAAFDGGSVTLQTLSANISMPREWQREESNVTFVITLKDGRKLSDVYTEDMVGQAEASDYAIRQIHAIPSCAADSLDSYIPLMSLYGTETDSQGNFSMVLCYSEPIAPQDVAEVELVRLTFQGGDAGTETFGGFAVSDEVVIYSAE